jgi:hypothetical protein
MPSSECRFLMALAGAVSLLLLVAAGVGHAEILAYAAPVALVALPLIGGRYIGEERIERFRRRLARGATRALRAPATPLARPRFEALVPRGSSLIAHGLAVRPPPGRAISS